MKKLLYVLFNVIVFITINYIYGATISIDQESSYYPIFVQVFCSIHMSIFVLFPLARIISKKKTLLVFGILFMIRVVILVIGDLINPMVMCAIDFFSVFIGAFIVIPVTIVLSKGLKVNSNHVDGFPNVSPEDFSNAGINNPEILKETLISKFVESQEAYSNQDYNKLRKLCDDKQYSSYKASIKMLEKKGYKNIINSFEIDNSKIYSVEQKQNFVIIFMVVNLKCYNYTIDGTGALKAGSKSEKINNTYNVAFKKVALDSKSIKSCPSCGAPVKDHFDECEYCSYTLDVISEDWRIFHYSKIF